MAKGPGTPAVPSLPVKVVIQPSAGTDGQLLFEAVSLTQNKSGLINQLAMRGWLNLLHGTPAVERSIQLRMIGLPDEVIAHLDAIAPVPHFLAMDGGQRSATAPAPAVQLPSRPQVQAQSRRQSVGEPPKDPQSAPPKNEDAQQADVEVQPKKAPPAQPESPSTDGPVFSAPNGGSGFGRDWGLS